MPKLRSIRELFDEQAEVMAWLLILTSPALLAAGLISDTVWLGSQMAALVTMLGAAHFKGVRINGLEVGNE